jgi:hypothetical protein
MNSRPVALAIVFAAMLLAGVLLFINERNQEARQKARCDEIRHSYELPDIEEYAENCS